MTTEDPRQGTVVPATSAGAGDDAFAEGLLARGIDSGLATRLALEFRGWAELKVALAGPALPCGLTTDESGRLKRAMERRDIPRPTVRRLVTECEFRCCLCWNLDADSGVVIHHIVPHETAPDDSYENLVVLCPNHHSVVHTSWQLVQHPFPVDLIRKSKQAFIDAIAGFRAGRRPAPGRESRATLQSPGVPPPRPSNFTGRASLSINALGKLCTGRRRVALVGMGGAGKTALALHVVEQVRPEFAGGIFWHEMIGGPVLQTLIRSLIGFLGADASDLDTHAQIALALELLVVRTRSGTILLAIDNIPAESLEGLAPVLSRLPPGTGLLVTSRNAVVAASLDATHIAVGEMERGDAHRLLALVSGSALVSPGAAGVDHLLDLIGDLPLAVELIGRQVALRSAKPGFEITALNVQLERFNDGLLSFPGHRGIAASFALSYDALDEPAKSAFNSIGIFADGPVQLEAVAQIIGVKRPAVEEIMDALVSLSLLKWGATPGDYRIHTLLHKFAAFQLERTSLKTREGLQMRFVDYFNRVLSGADESEKGMLARIDPAFDNACRAIQYASDLKLYASVSGMVQRLVSTSYLLIRSLAAESVPLFELAIRSAQNLGDSNAIAAHTANLGSAYHRIGQLREAFRHYKTSIDIVRRTGNDHDLASNLQNLGTAMLSEGQDPALAEKVLREAFEASIRSHNSDALIGTLSALGNMCRQVGRLTEARKFYSDALDASRLANVRLAEGNNLSNLGLVEQAMGRKSEAEKMFRGALSIAREIGDKRGEGNRLGHLAGLLTERIEELTLGPERSSLLESAIELLTDALRLARETRDAEKIACWLMNLGTCRLHSRNFGLAQDLYEEALEVAVRAGFAHVEAQARYNIGSLCLKQGQLEAALTALKSAAKILYRIRSPNAELAELRAAYVAHLIQNRGES